MRHETDIFIPSDTDFCTAPVYSPVEVIEVEKFDDEESLLAVEQLLATPLDLINENNYLPSAQQALLCKIAQQGKEAEIALPHHEIQDETRNELLQKIERGRHAVSILVKTNERFYKFFARRYREQGV